jgi:hypothetical protein
MTKLLLRSDTVCDCLWRVYTLLTFPADSFVDAIISDVFFQTKMPSYMIKIINAVHNSYRSSVASWIVKFFLHCISRVELYRLKDFSIASTWIKLILTVVTVLTHAAASEKLNDAEIDKVNYCCQQ